MTPHSGRILNGHYQMDGCLLNALQQMVGLPYLICKFYAMGMCSLISLLFAGLFYSIEHYLRAIIMPKFDLKSAHLF